MSSPLRVVHVNDIAFVGSTLVRALRREDVEAWLIEPARPGASVRLPWKLAMVPLRAAALVAAGAQIRFGNADLAHVHYARLGIVGPIGGKPYVLHCHGTDIRGVRPGSAWGRLVDPSLRAARLVYFSTPDLAPWVRAFRPDAIFLPNPIEVEDPATVPARAEAFEFDVLIGVRLDSVKGVPAIAAIVEALIARRAATTFSIIDQGGMVDVVERASRGHARVVSPVAHASLPAIFRRHRLAIGQQLSGALGNYELESMASGTPVVTQFRFAEAYDALPPVIDDGTPDKIAERMAALLDDEAERRSLARRGQAWITAHHAAAAIAATVAIDYRRLLGR